MGLIFNGNGDVIRAVDGSLTVEGIDLGGSTNINAGIGTFSGNLNVGGVLTYEDVKNVDSVGIITARGVIDAQGYINLAQKIIHTGDADTSIEFGTNTIKFETAGSERLNIDSTGILKLYGGAYSYIYGHRGGNLTYILGNDSGTNHFNIKTWQSSSDIIFSLSGNNEKVRITSAGNVGINETSPGHKLVVGGDGYFGFTTPNDAARQIIFNANRGSAGQTLANINWQWNSKNVAQIRGMAGADTSNKDDGHLTFYTSAANNLVERLRITSDGRIGINDPSPNDYELDIMKRSAATDAQMRLYNNATGSSNDTIMRYAVGGTTASNYIYFGDGDDSNVGQIVYNHSTDAMRFWTGANERLRIKSDGDVLFHNFSDNIGSNSSGEGFEFRSGEALRISRDQGLGLIVNRTSDDGDLITLRRDGSGKADLGIRSNALTFDVAGSERLRITSTGNLLVGATAVEDWDGSRSHKIQVRGDSSYNAGISALITANDDNPSELVLGKSRSTGNTIVGSADDVGQVRWSANDGAGFHSIAYIRCSMDGTPGSNDLPSNLRFGTSADGGTTVTERLRIKSDGNLGISRTNPQYRLHVHTVPTNSTQVTGLCIANDASSTGVGAKINLGAGNGYDSTSAGISGWYDGTGTSLSLFTTASYASTGHVERLRIDSDGHSYLAGRQYLARSGVTPVGGAGNLRETFFQAIASGASHTFQISNTYGGGLVYVVGSRHANANVQTTKIIPIAIRSTNNAHINSAISSVNGASGSFSYTVTGASKGITVTNNDGTYSCNCFVTFDITGFVG